MKSIRAAQAAHGTAAQGHEHAQLAIAMDKLNDTPGLAKQIKADGDGSLMGVYKAGSTVVAGQGAVTIGADGQVIDSIDHAGTGVYAGAKPGEIGANIPTGFSGIARQV